MRGGQYLEKSRGGRGAEEGRRVHLIALHTRGKVELHYCQLFLHQWFGMLIKVFYYLF